MVSVSNLPSVQVLSTVAEDPVEIEHLRVLGVFVENTIKTLIFQFIERNTSLH